MTIDLPVPAAARPRRYLMCHPRHFAVTYAINAWMDPDRPVDVSRALEQWEALRSTYLALGHTVEVIDPAAGLPDMVFAANGATVAGGHALTARFWHPERRPEAELYARWLHQNTDLVVHRASFTNEGEGDLLVLADLILAGTGFRTDPRAHREAAEIFERPVESLQLVDPRFYHLDTALTVLDDGEGGRRAQIAYFPGAFDLASRARLRRLFPEAVCVSESEATAFALNSVSDGRHVVVPAGAPQFCERLRAAGFEPIVVELDEFAKAGGSVKCCTLELR